MLQLDINRRPYIGSLMAPIDLTLSDLERPKVIQVSSDRRAVFCKYIFPSRIDINLDVTLCSVLIGRRGFPLSKNVLA